MNDDAPVLRPKVKPIPLGSDYRPAGIFVGGAFQSWDDPPSTQREILQATSVAVGKTQGQLSGEAERAEKLADDALAAASSGTRYAYVSALEACERAKIALKAAGSHTRAARYARRQQDVLRALDEGDFYRGMRARERRAHVAVELVLLASLAATWVWVLAR